mmetsp:Transcript_76108/g.235662  ORF Transcript_76108/g.235662 Transcript_76108/m.235662 type:complete len:268 (-) Transcript_76108:5-808(-)
MHSVALLLGDAAGEDPPFGCLDPWWGLSPVSPFEETSVRAPPAAPSASVTPPGSEPLRLVICFTCWSGTFSTHCSPFSLPAAAPQISIRLSLRSMRSFACIVPLQSAVTASAVHCASTSRPGPTASWAKTRMRRWSRCFAVSFSSSGPPGPPTGIGGPPRPARFDLAEPPASPLAWWDFPPAGPSSPMTSSSTLVPPSFVEHIQWPCCPPMPWQQLNILFIWHKQERFTNYRAGRERPRPSLRCGACCPAARPSPSPLRGAGTDAGL